MSTCIGAELGILSRAVRERRGMLARLAVSAITRCVKQQGRKAALPVANRQTSAGGGPGLKTGPAMAGHRRLQLMAKPI